MVGSSLDRTTTPAVILEVAGKSFAFGLRWTSAVAEVPRCPQPASQIPPPA